MGRIIGAPYVGYETQLVPLLWLRPVKRWCCRLCGRYHEMGEVVISADAGKEKPQNKGLYQHELLEENLKIRWGLTIRHAQAFAGVNSTLQDNAIFVRNAPTGCCLAT